MLTPHAASAQPGALVRIVRRGGAAQPWQAVDARTEEVIAANADERLLRADCHGRGWIVEDTRHL